MEEFLSTLRHIEKKWQKIWQEDQIFQPKVDKDKPKWFMTVPYPYATGPLHIGHCRTYTLGDVVARYKRHQGFNVLWPMAYHITGTPVLSISYRIRNRDPKIMEMYRSYLSLYESDTEKIEQILKSFEDPMNVAMYFAGKLRQDFDRMGFSIDYTRQFTTADVEYQKFIEWQFLRLNDLGFITQGSYPILWCTNDGNAVGEDDILGGDEEKVEVTEYIGVKFLRDDGFALVAATLRPETVFGATNVWVNPHNNYVEVVVDGKKWVVAQASIPQLELQNHRIEIQREFSGKELLFQEVSVPLVERTIPVLPAEFVNPSHATGVVYSVPAHAPYDYIALKNLQRNIQHLEENDISLQDITEEKAVKIRTIQPISLIKVDGYGKFPAVDVCERRKISSQNEVDKLDDATQEVYSAEFYSGVMRQNCGEFSGMKVAEAKIRAAEIFKEKNIGVSIYMVSRPVKCRCGTPISVAVIPDQYFLHYGNPQWKAKARSALERIEIYPEKYRTSFEQTFAWLDSRPCVRRRGLGTEFPLTKGKGWIIESLSDSVIYMAFYTVIKQIRAMNIKSDQLVPEFFDYIFLQQGTVEKVHKLTGISVNSLQIIQKEFGYWYPNDFRHTAVNHISNHLSFAIFHHAALFPPEYWLRIISLNDMLIREGSKMGKSKGNVVPIAYIPTKYSVDLTRLHMVATATADSIIDWRDKEVQHSARRLKRFWELITSAVDENESSQEMVENVVFEDLGFISQRFLVDVGKIVEIAQKSMERYQFRAYAQTIFFQFLRKFEQYHEINHQISIPEFKYVALFAIKALIPYWEPIIPHITEEINHLLSMRDEKNKGNYTVFAPFPPFAKLLGIDEKRQVKIKSQGEFVDHLEADIKNIYSMIKKPANKLEIYLAPHWKYALHDMLRQIRLKQTKNIEKGDGNKWNIKELMSRCKNNPDFKPFLPQIAKEISKISRNPGMLPPAELSAHDEFLAIKGYAEVLKVRYSLESLEIFGADQNGNGQISGSSETVKSKINQAQPFKPALIFK